MESYGINNKTINWARNFLTDRKQKVSVNGAESISQHVTSGIPQGSVYINMPDHVESEAYLFAGDTKVYKEIKTQTDTISLQKDLDNLQEWSDKWLLKFRCTQTSAR